MKALTCSTPTLRWCVSIVSLAALSLACATQSRIDESEQAATDPSSSSGRNLSARAADIDAMLAMYDGDSPGGAVMVIRDGEVVHAASGVEGATFFTPIFVLGHLLRFATSGGKELSTILSLAMFTVPGVILGGQLGPRLAAAASQRTMERGLAFLRRAEVW